MTLSAVRAVEENNLSEAIKGDDVDLESAFMIIKTIVEHNILTFHYIEQTAFKDFDLPEDKKQFFNTLPRRFKRDQAIEVAHTLGIPRRTSDNFLSRYLGSLFKRPKYGEYEKNFERL